MRYLILTICLVSAIFGQGWTSAPFWGWDSNGDILISGIDSVVVSQRTLGDTTYLTWDTLGGLLYIDLEGDFADSFCGYQVFYDTSTVDFATPGYYIPHVVDTNSFIAWNDSLWALLDSLVAIRDTFQADTNIAWAATATTTFSSNERGTDGANTTTPPTVAEIAEEVEDTMIAKHGSGLYDSTWVERGTDGAAVIGDAMTLTDAYPDTHIIVEIDSTLTINHPGDWAGIYDDTTLIAHYDAFYDSLLILLFGDTWIFADSDSAAVLVYARSIGGYIDSIKGITFDTLYYVDRSGPGSDSLTLYMCDASDTTTLGYAAVSAYAADTVTELWSNYSSADSGSVFFAVTSGNYYIRASKPGYHGTSKWLSVTTDTTDTIYLQPMVIPLPPDTNHCMIVFNAVDIGVTIPEGEIVSIRILTYPQYVDPAGISLDPVEVAFDSTGVATAAIWIGAEIRVEIEALGFDWNLYGKYLHGVVPDTSVIGWRDYSLTDPTIRWLLIN